MNAAQRRKVRRLVADVLAMKPPVQFRRVYPGPVRWIDVKPQRSPRTVGGFGAHNGTIHGLGKQK